MKRVIVWLLCLCLLVPSASVGELVQLDGELESQTRITFAFGGLPMLSDAQNEALESLMKALEIVYRQQGGTLGTGYVAADVLLQEASVLDFAMHAENGVYTETSNLLGGQTLAFDRESFAAFTQRLLSRSNGALPENQQVPFDVLMRLLGGVGEPSDREGLAALLAAVAQWQASAMMPSEVKRPEVWLPGIYGAFAQERDISRFELIALCRDIAPMLADDVTTTQAGDNDANDVRARMATATGFLRTLADSMEALLPESMPPIKVRDIVGLSGEIVSRQVEALLPEMLSLRLEWSEALHGDGVPAMYLQAEWQDGHITVLYTHEDGAAQADGKAIHTRSGDIAEIRFTHGDIAADAMLMHHEHVETRSDRVIHTARTELALESPALLGEEESVVSLLVLDVGTQKGQETEYKEEWERNVYIRGMGFEAHPVLTLFGKRTMHGAQSPIHADARIRNPANMTDEELDAWIADIQSGFWQIAYTVLGRLPPNVAMYVLENWFS